MTAVPLELPGGLTPRPLTLDDAPGVCEATARAAGSTSVGAQECLTVGASLRTDRWCATRTDGASSSGMEAFVGGVLERTDGCVMLDGNAVIWPDGTSWERFGLAVVEAYH